GIPSKSILLTAWWRTSSLLYRKFDTCLSSHAIRLSPTRTGLVDVRQVARELNVQYVLEGSVQRSGGRLRVTAQLIKPATGNPVWAERYDRSVHDVFDVQDEITKEIVLALSVELTDGERARVFSRSTRSLEAWLAAMRGFDHWAEGSPKGIREARAYFERAAL